MLIYFRSVASGEAEDRQSSCSRSGVRKSQARVRKGGAGIKAIGGYNPGVEREIQGRDDRATESSGRNKLAATTSFSRR